VYVCVCVCVLARVPTYSASPFSGSCFYNLNRVNLFLCTEEARYSDITPSALLADFGRKCAAFLDT